MSTYEQGLKRNIIKYSWYKIFTKRIYLPLIAVQLFTVGKVTLEELALIGAITSIVQLVLQLPGGYFADAWGNKRAIVFGAALASISPLFYVFMPNFWGGLAASVLFFGAYTFQQGAIEAFMHDTLIGLKREKQYSKVMGRAQSYGLIGNVVLIALVPATYAINHNLPFILGFISLLIMTLLAASFTNPQLDTAPTKKNPFAAARSIITTRNVILFIFAGIMTAVANQAPYFRELLFTDLGVAVALFGLILSVGSLVGAGMGFFIHVFDRFRAASFYLFDLSFMSGCLVVIGFTQNPWVAVAGFVLFTGYARVRQIIFQAKLLETLTHTYKATLISALNIFTSVAEVGAIFLLTKFIGFGGYSFGYVLFGVTTFGIGIVILGIMVLQARGGGLRGLLQTKRT